ncbi:hypothetical protein ACFWY6_18015 [Streptomyces sp. NPDC059037]|uniref:hypothetical protein n=1 Tax=Streptomyces sp. NPDC059037 TaxID=3346710 RepID=UPI00369B7A2F
MTSALTRPAILPLLAVAPLALLTACTQSGAGDEGKSRAIAVRAADDVTDKKG